MKEFKQINCDDDDDEKDFFYVQGNVTKYSIDMGDNSTLNIYGNTPKVEKKRNSRKSKRTAKYEGVLTSDKAKPIWAALRREGLVNRDNRPVGLSWRERGVLAKWIAEMLELDATPWKEFDSYWNYDGETMRTSCDNGYARQKTDAFIDRLNRLNKHIIKE